MTKRRRHLTLVNEEAGEKIVSITRKRKIIPAHPTELTECWIGGAGIQYSPPLFTRLYRWWMAKRGFVRVVDQASIDNWPEIWDTYEGTGMLWVRHNA